MKPAMEPHRTHLLAGLAALRESAECARASARRTLGAVLEAMVLAVLVRLLQVL